MPGARCVILYSEVVNGEPGSPEYALCLKQTIKHPAVLAELPPGEMERIEQIGLDGQFTLREQAYLQGVLLEVAGLEPGSQGDTEDAA